MTACLIRSLLSQIIAHISYQMYSRGIGLKDGRDSMRHALK